MIRVDVDLGGFADVPARLLEQGVLAACQRMGVSAGEFSIALLDDEEISQLNQAHLGHRGPTDVIAFALFEPGESPLGDVYLGFQQARRQAQREGVVLAEELVRLSIHGVLHVLGMQHPEAEEERDGSLMYVLQEALVDEVLRKAAG